MKKDIETFIKDNMRLVYKSTSVYQARHDYDDIVQEATIALMEAYEKYDESTGYAFSTLACRYIRGRVLNYIRDYGHVMRLPAYVQAIKASIQRNHWYDMADEEIAQKLNVRVSFVKTAKKELEKSWLSLDFEDTDDDKTSMSELFGKNDDFTKVIVDDFCIKLTEVERDIIRKKTAGYKPAEIATQRGITPQRVSNSIKNIKKKARVYFRNHG